MSSEVRVQIRRLLELFVAHLTGQCAVLLRPLRGGRRRCRTVQRTLLIVVPAAAGGRRRVHAEGLLVVGECVSHFVDDEAMAGQGGAGCEAGAALQTLLTAALGASSPVLADVLQEYGLVLCGEATGGTAEPGLRKGVRGRSRGGGGGGGLLHWTRAIDALFLRLHLHSSSPFPASPQTAVLL